MSFYQRNLPHWQPNGGEFFITFRLVGSLPKEAVIKIKNIKKQLSQRTEDLDNQLLKKSNRKIFQKYEELLDNESSGPHWLDQPEIANMLCDAIKYRDRKQYDLYSYCIMPNHVHLVFKLLNIEYELKYPVTKILQSLKRFTARQANQILNRKGQFWQHESYDRFIRDADELENTIRYVLNNPVKANLIKRWQD